MELVHAKAALLISSGASNKRGVARALVASIDADGPETSPATKLIFDQLHFLIFRTQTEEAIAKWDRWRKECESVVAEAGAEV